MSSFSLLLVSTLKFEAFTFPITSLCCFLAQTPRCIIWKVNTDLCVKNRHGRALNYLLLPEGDFPPSLRKLSWLGQTAHFSADYRTTELSPSPVPDQCGPHLSGGPPLLCLAGWECHHPKNEHQRNSQGRSVVILGRTLNPDTTLGMSMFTILK